MNNFRLSNKKVYKDSRSSIENLHNERIENIINNQNSLCKKENKLKFLNDKLNIIKNDNSNIDLFFKIKSEIEDIKKDIEKIKNQEELNDYIYNAWEFISNFNEDDKIIENNLQKTELNSEQLENIDDKDDNNKDDNKDNNTDNNKDDSNNNSILNFVNKKGKTTKGHEYKKYYDKCILNINYSSYNDSSNNYCKNCKNNNFEIDSKNGIIICTICGICETYFDNNNINYSDTTHIETVSQPFSYQRKNHFKEWLNQLQGKEVTIIPESVINLVLLEIKKERITDIDKITSAKIKQYLKKLKLNKYYEHIPNLISKITNKPPLIINEEFENVLLDLFDKIQEPFIKHCPKTRKNFLSYSYTLHKFCQLLGKNEYLIYFPLLKSREKLFEQEKIWKNICSDLNWKFMSSI